MHPLVVGILSLPTTITLMHGPTELETCPHVVFDAILARRIEVIRDSPVSVPWHRCVVLCYLGLTDLPSVNTAGELAAYHKYHGRAEMQM